MKQGLRIKRKDKAYLDLKKHKDNKLNPTKNSWTEDARRREKKTKC